MRHPQGMTSVSKKKCVLFHQGLGEWTFQLGQPVLSPKSSLLFFDSVLPSFKDVEVTACCNGFVLQNQMRIWVSTWGSQLVMTLRSEVSQYLKRAHNKQSLNQKKSRNRFKVWIAKVRVLIKLGWSESKSAKRVLGIKSLGFRDSPTSMSIKRDKAKKKIKFIFIIIISLVQGFLGQKSLVCWWLLSLRSQGGSEKLQTTVLQQSARMGEKTRAWQW